METESNKQDLETIIFTIIANSGDARSKLFEALNEAKNKNFAKSEELIDKANEILNEAHNAQTKLITNEINGNKVNLDLLLIHSQDHLMSTITTKDLIVELIDILKNINNN